MPDQRLHELARAVRRYHAETAAQADLELLQRLGLRPRTGGRNSAVYGVTLAGRDVCVKLNLVDARGRAQREWQALRVLAAEVPGRAPAPLWCDLASTPPVIVMELLPGAHLGGQRLDQQQLVALADLQAELHQITPATTPYPLPPAASAPAVLLQQISAFWSGVGDDGHAAWQREGARLWRRWSASRDPDTLRAPAPQVFSRGDPSLANCLWDGQRLRVVDFEHAGWRDRAVELADLVEHVEARNTPIASWEFLVDRFALDDRERTRFHAARRLFGLVWLSLLQPRKGRQPPSFRPAEQLDRTAMLFEES
jgi:Phosphotransferase enzyme family